MIADLNGNAMVWFMVVKNGGSFSPNRGGAIRFEIAGINRALLQ
jgi:hypothetical protein